MIKKSFLSFLVAFSFLLVLNSAIAGSFAVGYEGNLWRCTETNCEIIVEGNFSTADIVWDSKDGIEEGMFVRNLDDGKYYHCLQNECYSVEDSEGLNKCVFMDEFGGGISGIFDPTIFCLKEVEREIWSCKGDWQDSSCEKLTDYPPSAGNIGKLFPVYDQNVYFNLEDNLFKCGAWGCYRAMQNVGYIKSDFLGGIYYKYNTSNRLHYCNQGFFPSESKSCNALTENNLAPGYISEAQNIIAGTRGNIIYACGPYTNCIEVGEIANYYDFNPSSVIWAPENNFYTLEGPESDNTDRNLLFCDYDSKNCSRIIKGKFYMDSMRISFDTFFIVHYPDKILYSHSPSTGFRPVFLNGGPVKVDPYTLRSMGIEEPDLFAVDLENKIMYCNATDCNYFDTDNEKFYLERAPVNYYNYTTLGENYLYTLDSEGDMWFFRPPIEEDPAIAKQISSEPFYSKSIRPTLQYFSINNKCSGAVPKNSVICSGDNSGLTESTENIFVEECTTERKCEYVCEKGYQKIGSECIKGEDDKKYGIYLLDNNNDLWRCTDNNCVEVKEDMFTTTMIVDNNNVVFIKKGDGNVAWCDEACYDINNEGKKINFRGFSPNFDFGIYAHENYIHSYDDRNFWFCDYNQCIEINMNPKNAYSTIMPINQKDFFWGTRKFNKYMDDDIGFYSEGEIKQFAYGSFQGYFKMFYDLYNGVYTFYQKQESSSNYDIFFCDRRDCYTMHDGAYYPFGVRTNTFISPKGNFLVTEAFTGKLLSCSINGCFEVEKGIPKIDFSGGARDKYGNVYTLDRNDISSNWGLWYCTSKKCSEIMNDAETEIQRGFFYRYGATIGDITSITYDWNEGIFAFNDVEDKIIHCTKEKCKSVYSGILKPESFVADGNTGMFALDQEKKMWHCNLERCEKISEEVMYFDDNIKYQTMISDLNGGIYSFGEGTDYYPLFHCDSNSCKQLTGELFNNTKILSVFQKEVPYSEEENGDGQHLECHNDNCVFVEGEDECVRELVDDPYCIARHRECDISENCNLVLGEDIDSCSTALDCILQEEHLECHNDACVIVNGFGEDECEEGPAGDAFCATQHRECNAFGNCELLNGEGNDLCYFNSECGFGGNNSITLFTGTSDRNILLNIKCLRDVNDDGILTMNGEEEIFSIDANCFATGNQVRIDGKDLNEGQVYSISLEIPEPCAVCTKTIYVAFTGTGAGKGNINIPDNNIASVFVILIALMSIFILNKKETQKLKKK